MPELTSRYPHNPLLRPADIKASHAGMQVECLLNPGIFRFDNKTWMLVRVAERPVQKKESVSFPVLDESGRVTVIEINRDEPDLDLSDARIVTYKGHGYLSTLSHLRLLSSADGVSFTESAEYPPVFGSGSYETYGVEDCRVAKIDDIYYLTYTAVSPNGVGVGLMTTADWKQFDRKGMILPPHNKDCALFEQKINGLYYMLHRPSSVFIGGNYIWIASSPDLQHWGSHRCIAQTRKGKWDSERVGAGASPILTSEGWLQIYHGADSGHRYCLGALLLDKSDPAKVIARSEEPIMEPLADYEKQGFFGNVVFTNGHIVEGDRLTIYYGASDEVICQATLSITAVLRSLSGNDPGG